MPAYPRVSVVMAARDGERYLDEAIESILSQDYSDFELVIVDDGSADSTPAILSRWAARDPRVKPITLRPGVGVARATNVGLQAAQGEYIARHDHDDVSEPGRLRAEVEALDRDASAVVVSTNLYVIDAEGNMTGAMQRQEPPEVIAYFLHFFNVLGGGGQVMLRRDTLLSEGGYAERLDSAIDYELWVRMIQRGRIVVLPIYGMRYRQHPESLSRRARGQQRATAKDISRAALARLLDRRLTDDEVQALAHLWYLELGSGRIGIADRVMREAYVKSPASLRQQPGRGRVAFVTARQMMLAGTPMLWRGSPLEFLSHLTRALRRHPLGCAEGLLASVSDAFRVARSRMRV